jgi:hypothetical protein
MSLCLLAFSLLLSFSPTHQSSHRRASIFTSFVEKYEGDSTPWKYHMAVGLPHNDCQLTELLTCDDILSAKVAFYLGKGRHKTALRAVLHNHTVVIRTTSRPKCLSHFLSLFLFLSLSHIPHKDIYFSIISAALLSILNFNYSNLLPFFFHTVAPVGSLDSEYSQKVKIFESEWKEMSNASLCSPQRPVLYGTCHDELYMADVVELVIPFSNVLEIFQREKAKAREWWCWVVGWVMDILELLILAEKKGLYVHTRMFGKPREFGVSAMSLTLKVRSLSYSHWLRRCLSV